MITNCLVQILLRISICFFHENMKALHTIKSSKIQENDSLLPKIPKRPKPANPFWKFDHSTISLLFQSPITFQQTEYAVRAIT